MKKQFTALPWTEHLGTIYGALDGKHVTAITQIITSTHSLGPSTEAEVTANKVLIVSAPELYARLVNAERWMRKYYDGPRIAGTTHGRELFQDIAATSALLIKVL